MDIQKILDYQAVDLVYFNLTKKLAESENKKGIDKCKQVVENAKKRTQELEAKSQELFKQYDDAYKKCDHTTQSFAKIKDRNIANMTEKDVDYMLQLSGKISNNFSILYNYLKKVAESIQDVLIGYTSIRKQHEQAKADYAKFFAEFEKEKAEVAPKLKELEEKLKVLQKDVAPDIMEAYITRRNDKKGLPVVVPIEGKNCGRCRMELPNIALSKINELGVITCEHCKRINYKK